MASIEEQFYKSLEQKDDKYIAIINEHPHLLNVIHPRYGQTFVHYACQMGHAQCLKLLLKKSSCSCIDMATLNYKYTPMHFAAENGHHHIINILLKSGSTSMDARNNSGNTPLHLAAMYNHVKCANILKKYGSVSTTITTNFKALPLHWAIHFNNMEMFNFLLEWDSSVVNATDDSMNTPLHYAAMYCSEHFIYALIKAGATNLEVINDAGQTPLSCAINAERYDNVMLLRFLGASVNNIKDLEMLPEHIQQKYLYNTLNENDIYDIRQHAYFGQFLYVTLLNLNNQRTTHVRICNDG